MTQLSDRYPIIRSTPTYVHMTSWMGHVPVAMLLIDMLRPSVFVELGTHYGVSLMAFCQASKELNSGTRCYAVDTWEGDAQTGPYTQEVLQILRAHHDPAYG